MVTLLKQKQIRSFLCSKLCTGFRVTRFKFRVPNPAALVPNKPVPFASLTMVSRTSTWCSYTRPHAVLILTRLTPPSVPLPRLFLCIEGLLQMLWTELRAPPSNSHVEALTCNAPVSKNRVFRSWRLNEDIRVWPESNRTVGLWPYEKGKTSLPPSPLAPRPLTLSFSHGRTQ